MHKWKWLVWMFFFSSVLCACKSDDKANSEESAQANVKTTYSNFISPSFQFTPKAKALMASRFNTLEDLREVVEMQYFTDSMGVDSGGYINPAVRLVYSDNENEIRCYLESGISQGDIIAVRDGDTWDGISLVINSPYAIANRESLNKIYVLARRRAEVFGEGDVAFYDLAETAVANISTPGLAFLVERDSSEKGFINTFNHVTAQALITTLFNEELAGFIADVHERYHMPELVTGKFSPEQLTDPDKNPIDNYVDIVNNKLGQELGSLLKEKYQIKESTVWTPQLLANYLNDINSFYSWSLHIGFKPFKPEDELITRFTAKMNTVSEGVPYIAN